MIHRGGRFDKREKNDYILKLRFGYSPLSVSPLTRERISSDVCHVLYYPDVGVPRGVRAGGCSSDHGPRLHAHQLFCLVAELYWVRRGLLRGGPARCWSAGLLHLQAQRASSKNRSGGAPVLLLEGLVPGGSVCDLHDPGQSQHHPSSQGK